MTNGQARLGIAVATFLVWSGGPRAESKSERGTTDWAGAARECTKFGEIAQTEQKEMLRLLARIADRRKPETNRQKLVAAWGRYREANDRIDECIKKYFDELPRL